jgi:hypothetical protein
MESNHSIEILSLKLKIAVLWLCCPVLEAAHLLLIIEDEGLWLKRHGNLMVHSTFFLLLPVILCVLTLLLNDHWNRKINLIVGIVPMGLFNFFNFLECGIGVAMYTGPAIGIEQPFLLGTRIIISVIIVWLAWKWPHKNV